jgi:hypothetical protein
MKAGFVSVFLSLFIGVLQGQADLNTALGKGDITAISGHLADKVELVIGNTDDILLKAEAVNRLKEFYAAHQAKGFRAMHTGTSKTQESNYAIGELATDKGNYRVYIYFTQEAQRRQVTELRIEQ